MICVDIVVIVLCFLNHLLNFEPKVIHISIVGIRLMVIIHLFSKNIQIMFLTILNRKVIKATFNADFTTFTIFLQFVFVLLSLF